uniref:Uncharacterized protein n=1 Tax=Brassica oleracea TaxID=3712 RepID=A0A3P6FF58_BRAOL|nr:unnamed protein product [Brassica oleracea]
MLGKSCVMTKSGVSCRQLKMMEAPERGSVGMYHIQQALNVLKPIPLMMMKLQIDPWESRQQRPVLRKQWEMGKICLSFRQYGASKRKIWL